MGKPGYWILAAVGLAACGDGSSASDFVGLYEVTHHTRNETSCEQEGAAVTEYSHFALREGEILGQSYLSFGECTSGDPESCSDLGLFSAFIKYKGDWVNEIHSSSGGGDVTCYLGFLRGTMEELEPGVLRFEIRSYSEEDDTLSEEECDPDTAEARGTDMPCEQYEVIEGRFIADLPPSP